MRGGSTEGDQDIQITADATARVGDVADALAGANQAKGAAVPTGMTLRVIDASGRSTGALNPRASLVDSGIRSGSTMELTQAQTTQDRRGGAAALLRVLAGPDVGIEVPLPVGSSEIGRTVECDVKLNDPLVSKRHARINVSDKVEIIDTNSSNGVLVGGVRVARVQLGSGDTAILGDTEISIQLLRREGGLASTSTDIPFVRPPRVVPQIPQATISMPEVPQKQDSGRFPWLAMVAPLVMGAVLFLTTRSATSLMFVGLSPLLMGASFIDQRVRGRRKERDDAVMFEASLVRTQADLAADQDHQRSAARAAYPSAEDCVSAVSTLDPLLWSRRSEHPQFLTLRLGLGAVPSTCTLDGVRPGGIPEMAAKVTALAAAYERVPDAPVIADMRSCGALGLCGDRALLDGVARAVVLQAAVLHSPAELVVTMLTSTGGLARWDWLQWLPHTCSPHSPLAGPHLSADPSSGLVLVSQLEDLVASRADAASKGKPALRGPLDKEDKPGPAIIPSVLVIVDTPMVDRSRLTRIAELGADMSIHVIWCASTRAELPAACRTYLELSPNGNNVGHVRLGRAVAPVVCESIDNRVAMGIARRLAPVVDSGVPVEDASDLPRSVPVVSLLDRDAVDDPAAVVARWRENRSLVERGGPMVPLERSAGLNAVVGHSGTEPFSIDLRSHGPHALVGGTTGAGKSEFLQAWVLGLAHAYSPDRVTFLFVDYKGGSAFSKCTELPHHVGLVTDLSPHLVRRALRSLRAEIHHREELLQAKAAKDLLELELAGDPDCPPSLIIVIDEFAALVSEVPEFVDGVVDVAARGRSLGLHLILATQRPAGVIKDNLRANTNLRVALRMADEHESSDVLGDKMAAHFDPSVPGRGAAKTGPGRITPFQSAFPGSRTPAEPPAAPIDVVELGFGFTKRWRMPERPSAGADVPKDIERVVSTVKRAAQLADIPQPRKPWRDTLAPTYNLELLHQRSDAMIALGVLDDPDAQDQYTEYFRPDEDGHILFYGAGGSGKSTALRTLAVASSITPRSGGAQVYGLDFAGGALDMLRVLPHVGAIIPGDDDERVARLLRRLNEIVDTRSSRYSAARASTLTEFRSVSGESSEQRILLLVDGFGTFRNEYESTADRLAIYNLFQQLLVDGRAVGVHVAMTADRPAAVPTSIGAAFQRKVVLRLVDEDAYVYLGVPKDVLNPTSEPGRAMQVGRPNELQLAILGDSVNVAAQARAIEELAAENAKRVTIKPESIRSLPSTIPYATLPADVLGKPTLGVADDTLAPFAFDPSGTILIAGPAQSGRTNAVRWFAESTRRCHPQTPLVHFSARRSPLSELGTWALEASGLDACAAIAAKVKAIAEEASTDSAPLLAIFVESYPDFVGTPAEGPMVELVKLCRRNGHMFVAEGETSAWVSPWPLVQEVRNGRTGLLLQPDQTDGDSLLRTSLPRVRRSDLPPGRGFWIRGGRSRKVQVPLVD
ncbi:MAG: FHA domain-containing protein [Actinomycetales bacterium]|nr:FHA domain-containing protein [Actinomycetales bacterium]